MKPDIRIGNWLGDTYIINLTEKKGKSHRCFILKRVNGPQKEDWEKTGKDMIKQGYNFSHLIDMDRPGRSISDANEEQRKEGVKIWQRINEEIVEEGI